VQEAPPQPLARRQQPGRILFLGEEVAAIKIEQTLGVACAVIDLIEQRLDRERVHPTTSGIE